MDFVNKWDLSVLNYHNVCYRLHYTTPQEYYIESKALWDIIYCMLWKPSPQVCIILCTIVHVCCNLYLKVVMVNIVNMIYIYTKGIYSFSLSHRLHNFCSNFFYHTLLQCFNNCSFALLSLLCLLHSGLKMIVQMSIINNTASHNTQTKVKQ